MERGPLLVASVLLLCVGGMGFLPPRPGQRLPLPWQAALPALLVFLFSLPTTGAFAPGQALGNGVLLGGLLGTLAAWLVLCERPIAALGAALLPLPLLLLSRGLFPLDNLLGATLGGLSALCTTGRVRAASLRDLTVVGGGLVAVAGAMALGSFRSGALAPGGWLGVPLLLATGLLVVASVLERLPATTLRPVIGGVGYALLAGLAARPLAAGMSGYQTQTQVCLSMALVLGGMLLWLRRAGAPPALGVLLTVVALTASNHLLQGYGVALLGLGLAALALLTEEGEALEGALVAAALTVLWRLTAQRFDETRGIGLHEQYLLVGLLLGGLLPRLAARLTPLVSASATLLAVPITLGLLYGAPALLALVLGLVAGQLWGTAEKKHDESEPSPVALYALGVAGALAQLLGHLAPLASKTRLERLQLTGGTVLVWLVALGIGVIWARKKP